MVERMKQYEIRKNEGVKVITLPAIEDLDLVCHGFSTKEGGVSGAPYKGLNLSLNAGDDKDLVEINRCMFVKALEAGNPDVYTVRQMHGSRVLRIEDRENPPEEYRQAQADAIVTDQPGVAIGVLTADCAPVLLVDPEKRVIAAVHAGRQGTLMRVVSHVVSRMQKDFGSSPDDLLAAVGPCIETTCYQVGEEIAQEVSLHDFYQNGVLLHENGAYFVDLRKMNHLDLLESGVKDEHIYDVSMCTACHPRIFYSHRKNKGKKTGRMMALIMLKE
jgi:YfiH family protein